MRVGAVEIVLSGQKWTPPLVLRRAGISLDRDERL
jgi:hypothetical protein